MSLDTRPVFPQEGNKSLEGYWLGKTSFLSAKGPNPTDFVNESSTIPNVTQEKLLVVEHYITELGGSEKCIPSISQCELCHKKNGNCYFELDGFKWPSGYIHYLRDHHTIPSLEFENALKKWYPEAKNHETPVENVPISMPLETAQDEIVKVEEDLVHYSLRKPSLRKPGLRGGKKSVKRSVKKRKNNKKRSLKKAKK